MRVYITLQDFFTIADSKGTRDGSIDPEIGVSERDAYPFAKSISIGLDVTLPPDDLNYPEMPVNPRIFLSRSHIGSL